MLTDFLYSFCITLLFSLSSTLLYFDFILNLIINDRIKINLIKYFAPASFGVYLLHVQPLVWNKIIKNGFVFIGNFRTSVIPFSLIACGFLILITGLIIDNLRIIIFKILRIDKIPDKIENMINYIIKKRSTESI